MKRDMDLVRAILLALEGDSIGADPNKIGIEGYDDQRQILYHVYLLIEGGLVRGDVVSQGGFGDPPQALPYGLTWTGHEFLDAAREDGRWKEAKGLLDKVGGAALAVWQTVLTKLVLKNLGME